MKLSLSAILLLSSILLSSQIIVAATYNRANFPEEFVFGAGTSSYQYEGAVAEDGRSKSIWDDFTHAGKMIDKSTADIAADGYHKYKATQKGIIGINIYSLWCSPYSDSPADIKAAQRVLDFFIGWIINPLVYGDYPKILKKIVGNRLPSFTESEKQKIKGSTDFIALNHYSTVYVTDNSKAASNTVRDFTADMLAILSASKDDQPGTFAPAQIISDPPGLRKILNYLKNNYGNVPIYIQENGYGLAATTDVLNDTKRIAYLDGYIESTLEALRDGVDVRGYFVWSFIDVFEFLAGYQTNFGLYHVAFEDVELKRQPKLSAHWYSKFLASKHEILKKTSDSNEHVI